VISVGNPDSDGSVITEGSRGNGNAPGDGLPVVVVGVPEFSLDAVGASAAGWSRVGGATGAALDGGVVEVFEVMVGAMVVAGSCGGAPGTSCTMPQMISPSRTAVSTPHPTNAIGLRQPGIGSSGSGFQPP
jgi:hypothetical protein